MFRNKPKALLDILEFIEEYNLQIYSVDIANQLRSYYNTKRVYRKTQKLLFSFLLDTIIGNSYQLSTYRVIGKQTSRHYTHLAFRQRLRDALFHSSIYIRQQLALEKRKGTIDIVWRPVKEHQHKELWRKQVFCSAYTELHHPRVIKRPGAHKPLADLSTNTTIKLREDSRGQKRHTRPPKTRQGCSVYRIPFYIIGPYQEEHLAKLNSKDQPTNIYIHRNHEFK